MKPQSSPQAGFSLMEIIVVLGASTSILMAASYGFLAAQKQIKRIEASGAQSQTVSNITDGVTSNITRSQICFNNNEGENGRIATLLDSVNLPLGFGDGTLSSIKTCPECRGLMGYVVYPHHSYRGLYMVRFKTHHRDLGLDNSQEYQFVISSK